MLLTGWVRSKWFWALCVLAVLIALFFKLILTSPKSVTPDKCIQDQMEALKSLPYTDWSQEKGDVTKAGVTTYDLERSFAGYNLYADYGKDVTLIDMNGDVVHTWTYPEANSIQYADFLPETGELLLINLDHALVKLDWNSALLLSFPITAHHDFVSLGNNEYLVPFYRLVKYKGRQVRFDGFLKFRGPDSALKEWWSYPNLEELKQLHPVSPLEKPFSSDFKLPTRQGVFQTDTTTGGNTVLRTVDIRTGQQNGSREALYDYYHINTLEVLPDTPLGRRDSRFSAGNILLCLRNADLIVILDSLWQQVVWSWGPGELDLPHMPTMLPNGNILIFDNGFFRGYSRVVELEPVQKQIVWEYTAKNQKDFFSAIRGSAQRLPNGNTLICESDKGHAFEVTAEKEIVWEYWNNKMDKKNHRAAIYRMTRLLPGQIQPWLKGNK